MFDNDGWGLLFLKWFGEGFKVGFWVEFVCDDVFVKGLDVLGGGLGFVGIFLIWILGVVFLNLLLWLRRGMVRLVSVCGE